MTKSLPVMLAARSLASNSTRSATSARMREPAGDALRGLLIGDLFGARPAGLRHGRGHAVVAEPEIGLHRAGADRVHPHPCAELLRQRLAEVGQRPLRRAVVDDRRVGQERVHRADRDDARARVARSSAGSAARMVRTAARKLRFNAHVPVLVREREEPVEPRTHRADVVDQQVDAADTARPPRRPAPPARPACVRSTWHEAARRSSASSSALPCSAPATTLTPSDASARVMARPMPLLAPVTTATFPARCRSIRRPFAAAALQTLLLQPGQRRLGHVAPAVVDGQRVARGRRTRGCRSRPRCAGTA